MNFQDLLTKMKAIDEGSDQPVAECGDAPMPGHVSQPNNVTMNVSMSGQGADGIKDLLGILRDIENGEHDDGAAIVVGEPGAEMDPTAHDEPIMGDSVGDEEEPFGNSMKDHGGPKTGGIDDIVFTGDDLAGNTAPEPAKKQGGGNPYSVSESLVSRLNELYTEVKSR